MDTKKTKSAKSSAHLQLVPPPAEGPPVLKPSARSFVRQLQVFTEELDREIEAILKS